MRGSTKQFCDFGNRRAPGVWVQWRGGFAGTGTLKCQGRLSWDACPSAGMTLACSAAEPCTGWTNWGCSAWWRQRPWGSSHPQLFLPGGDAGAEIEDDRTGPELCSAVFSLLWLPPAPLFLLKHETWLLPYPLQHTAAPCPSCPPPPAPQTLHNTRIPSALSLSHVLCWRRCAAAQRKGQKLKCL